MVKRKIKKRIVYVKLEHPSGRVTTKKLMTKSKSLGGIQKEYLGTAEHFRTEAYPIKIVTKPKRKRKRTFGFMLKRSRSF